MKPIVLAILDGVGLREEEYGNAFKQANKPTLDYLWKEYPHSRLDASGKAVGLPEGQMGNSEVGHLNIGAGRIVYQPFEQINVSINDNSFYDNKVLLDVINHVKENNSKLHIMGLVSDGGVHSHIDHIKALLKLSKKHDVKVYIHCFMDGRDTLPDKALVYLEELNNYCALIGTGKISTIAGRYYAMDRDKRWDRLKLAYDAMVNGIGEKNDDIKQIIENSFNNKIYDEFIVPTIVDDEGVISDNDGVIIANFRPDRIVQIGTALTNEEFNEFEVKRFFNLKVATMMPVASSVKASFAFEPIELHNTLGTYLSSKSLKQLRIAETEKYAHVTYFFDGGRDIEIEGCKRILIPSPKIATYDLKPEMSANEVTEVLIKELDEDYDIVILNFANCDMVGHTGDMEATIKAVEAVDRNLGLIYEKLKLKDGLLIVMSDHGNSEYMIDEDNNIVTSHTNSKVPFIVCKKNIKLKDGKLGDVAPTILKLMDIEVPDEMTGDNLIID